MPVLLQQLGPLLIPQCQEFLNSLHLVHVALDVFSQIGNLALKKREENKTKCTDR